MYRFKKIEHNVIQYIPTLIEKISTNGERTFDSYFDFKPVEKILHEGLARQIKEGRFGG